MDFQCGTLQFSNLNSGRDFHVPSVNEMPNHTPESFSGVSSMGSIQAPLVTPSPAPGEPESTFVYDAFISYRRGDGARVAVWLRERLRRFRLPPSLQPGRPMGVKIYQDTAYLRATEDFYVSTLKPALRASRFLIVVATPSALQRRSDGQQNWLEREVAEFLTSPQRVNLIVVRAGGGHDDPLPARLGEVFPNIHIADLRDINRDRWRFGWHDTFDLESEFLSVAAPLFHVPLEEMPALRQEDERRRVRDAQRRAAKFATVGVALLGLLVVAVLGYLGSRRQLARTQITAGQASYADLSATARLNFCEAVEQTSLFGIALPEARLARRWLGLWADKSGPTFVWLGKPVVALEFSPDGRTLLAGTEDGYFQTIDVASGAVLNRFTATGVTGLNARYDPSQRYLITFSRTWPQFDLRDARLGTIIATTFPFPGPIGDVVFDPTGKRFVVGSGNGEVQAFRSETAERCDPRMDLGEQVAALQMSADGRILAALGYDGSVQAWRFPSGKPVGPRRTNGRKVEIYPGIFKLSRNGRRVLWGTLPRVVSVIDPASTATKAVALRQTGEIMGADIDGSGQRVVTGDATGAAQLWQTLDGLPLGQPMRHLGPIHSIAFSPDGRWILSTSEDRTARVWSGTVGGEQVGLSLEHWGVDRAIFSPDGTRIATAGTDGVVQIHSWFPPDPDVRYVTPGIKRVNDVTFGTHGTGLWELADAGELWWVPDGTGAHDAQNFPALNQFEWTMLSPNGEYVFAQRADGAMARWALADGAIVPAGRAFPGADEILSSFSGDARFFVTVEAETTHVWIYDFDSGRRREIPCPRARGSDYILNEHGRELWWNHGTADAQHIVNTSNGREVATLNAIRFGVNQMGSTIFHPDDKRLLTFPDLKVMQVVTRRGGQPRTNFMRGVAPFSQYRISGNGEVIVTQDELGRVILWDVDTGTPIGPVWRPVGGATGIAIDRAGRKIAVIDGPAVLVRSVAPATEAAPMLTRQAIRASGMTFDRGAGAVVPLSGLDYGRRLSRLRPAPRVQGGVSGRP